MFLAGLKFALGLVVGLTLLPGVVILGIVGAVLFDRWRRERRFRRMAKARDPHRATPRFRERAVFCFRFDADDWKRKRPLSESLREKL